MRVLVAGAGGMVGRAAIEHCSALGDEVFAYDHKSLDIADELQVGNAFDNARPEIVINCAAWTDVDGCEFDHERAFRVNARGPELLASHSRRMKAGFVTISTDYVFDGSKEGFYTQRDDPNPQSVYAASKLEGERRAYATSARTIVVRTGWVFGHGGKNFLSRVVEYARSGKPLKSIADSYGTPTYSVDLAARLRELALIDLPGLYHIVNGGHGASFAEFARESLIIAGRDPSIIEDVKMDSLQRPAPRPRNSRLRCILSEAIGLKPMPEWCEALASFIRSE
ncbi:MAG: dTDP-4-dehydrorhamnose reductase [Acidobacteria bacterium 13_1_20CM_3_53_8]|nr:MAG: dTDP-4-dehydrorhamnose reductase [Acidobacteria bacterium 13_1_20CM_3_53_8]